MNFARLWRANQVDCRIRSDPIETRRVATDTTVALRTDGNDARVGIERRPYTFLSSTYRSTCHSH